MFNNVENAKICYVIFKSVTLGSNMWRHAQIWDDVFSYYRISNMFRNVLTKKTVFRQQAPIIDLILLR